MAPRRPTAPQAGAARARVPARPAGPPRTGSGRDRPPSAGRASSRPQSTPGTPPAGLAAVSVARSRPPLIRPMTMLSGVVVVLVLLLAPYVRPWVTQRSQIEAGNEQVRALQREVEQLTEERRRWEDPAYVRAQARERLHFVMPGETGYVVLDDQAPVRQAPDPRSAAAATLPADAGGVDPGPWYAKVWNSVKIAGDPTTEQARSSGAGQERNTP